MKLFDRIFGGKKAEQTNPSAGWTADLAAPIEVDLAGQRFGGVGLGEPTRALERLGPSSGWTVHNDEVSLAYSGLGFTVFIDPDGLLEGVDINLLAEEDMAAFGGEWTVGGRRVAISSATTPDEVSAILGKPEEAKLGDSSYLVYRRPGGLVEFDWGGPNLENILINRQ